MYNRYIPQDSSFGPIPPQEDSGPRGGGGSALGGLLGSLLKGQSGGSGKVTQTLSSLFKGLGLKELDAGDILLALVVLLLILEDGDDLELVIALALMILMNLGESS